jgi:cysteine protease ATG4
MVAIGMKYNQLPGEWYSPGIACHILRDLCNSQQQQQQTLPISPIRVYIAQEGTVYQDRIHQFMTTTTVTKRNTTTYKSYQDNTSSTNTTTTTTTTTTTANDTNTNTNRSTTSLHPLVPEECGEEQNILREEWDGSLLLFIPLRLGLNNFQYETYGKSLSQTFALSSSVGILGGSPRYASWFYGSSFSTTATTTNSSTINPNFREKWYGLDPHTIQPALTSNTTTSSPPQPCLKPCEIDLQKLDPSMALGFYFYQKNDFIRWCHEMKHIYDNNNNSTTNTTNKKSSVSSSELFSIIARSSSTSFPPTTSSMNNYTCDSSIEEDDDDTAHDGEEDEEYVFL